MFTHRAVARVFFCSGLFELPDGLRTTLPSTYVTLRKTYVTLVFLGKRPFSLHFGWISCHFPLFHDENLRLVVVVVLRKTDITWLWLRLLLLLLLLFLLLFFLWLLLALLIFL